MICVISVLCMSHSGCGIEANLNLVLYESKDRRVEMHFLPPRFIISAFSVLWWNTQSLVWPHLSEQQLRSGPSSLLSPAPGCVLRRRENGPNEHWCYCPQRLRMKMFIWNRAAVAEADVEDELLLFTERDNAMRRILLDSNRAKRGLLGGELSPWQ